MKHVFIILLTLRSLVVYGQGQPDPYRPAELRGWHAFRGNPFERSIELAPMDTLAAIKVQAFDDSKVELLPPAKQPAVSRSGVSLQIRWANTATMPQKVWIKISIGGIVRMVAWLLVDQDGVPTAPGSVTVVNYVISPGGGASPSGALIRVYSVENVSSGHVLPHSGASRLLVGDCYPSDTKQADPLWKIEAFDDNTCVLRGPPTETFSGTVVVTVFQKLTN